MSEPEFVNPSPEPDEDSTENVFEALARYDRELLQHDMLPLEGHEDILLRDYSVSSADLTDLVQEGYEHLAEEEFEEFTTSLRTALTTPGLADPSSVTPEKLKEIDIEILRQLDPLNAESLFFDTARKVHRQLGLYEPVSWKILLEQAQLFPLNQQDSLGVPEGIKSEKSDYLDLDKLRLEQRLKDYDYLIGLGIDRKELSRILTSEAASPDIKQNINRLAYYFQEEPILRGFVESLRSRTAERGPISLEKAIRMSQIILRFRMERLDTEKTKQTHYASQRPWDSINREVYRRMTKRMRHSIAISNNVLFTMRLRTVEDFINSIEG